MTDLRDMNLRMFKPSDARWVTEHKDDPEVQDYMANKMLRILKCTNPDSVTDCDPVWCTMHELRTTGLFEVMGDKFGALRERLTPEQDALLMAESFSDLKFPDQ